MVYRDDGLPDIRISCGSRLAPGASGRGPLPEISLNDINERYIGLRQGVNAMRTVLENASLRERESCETGSPGGRAHAERCELHPARVLSPRPAPLPAVQRDGGG